MGWMEDVGQGIGLVKGVGEIAGPLMSGASSAEGGMQSRLQAKREWEEKRRIQRAREAAYNEIIRKGGQDFGTGENAFIGESSSAVPEMAQAKQDVLAGSAEGLNQAQSELGSNLQKEGVRGGQAATQLRRNAGQMGIETQRMLNEMALTDAQRRQQERSQYYSGKAARGQTATYSQPTF